MPEHNIYRDIKEQGRKFQDYLYYGMVGAVSLVALLFLPMVGSTANLGWVLPTTTAGWLVFIMTKLMVASLNMILFHSFVKQARLNIRTNENYLRACSIYQEYHDKAYRPRALNEFNRHEYGSKLTTIFITSLLSTFTLGQALLMFDWMSFLSYLFVIFMGIIFGILEMKKYEDYYTSEFLDCAIALKAEKDREAENARLAANESNPQPNSENTSEAAVPSVDSIGGASLLEPPDSNGLVGVGG